MADTRVSAEGAVRTAIRGRGLRCTAERVEVLLTLATAEGHLTVADIHERTAARGRRVDLSTVYRAVTTLQENGLVHTVAVADHAVTYGLAEQPHHHAVCSSCGQITEIPAAPLAEAVSLAQTVSGFALEHDSMQLHGLCARCRDRAART